MTTHNCEACGQPVDRQCEYGDCRNVADYEGWFRGGGMLRRLCVCAEHIELSIGRQAGEPLPTEAS